MTHAPDAQEFQADLPAPAGFQPDWRRVYGFAMAAAFLSALVALGIGESIKGAFRPRTLPALSDPFSNANDLLVLASQTREAITTFEAFGGLLGLTFGVAGGLARRKPISRLIVPGVVGLLLGVGVAFLTTKLLMPVADANRGAMVDDLVLPLWVLGGMWSPMGLVAGFAFALGLWPVEIKTLPRAALGGLLGAALGTAIYLCVGAVLLPLSETGNPIPATLAARSLARLVVALATGIAVAGLVSAGRQAKPAPPSDLLS